MQKQLCFFLLAISTACGEVYRGHHCPQQSFGNRANVKRDSKDRGPGQGNKAEEKKKEKNEIFKTLLAG